MIVLYSIEEATVIEVAVHGPKVLNYKDGFAPLRVPAKAAVYLRHVHGSIDIGFRSPADVRRLITALEQAERELVAIDKESQSPGRTAGCAALPAAGGEERLVTAPGAAALDGGGRR